jgi:lysophospholipase L1-like esterase
VFLRVTFRLPVHINLGVNHLFLRKLLTFCLGLGMFLPAAQAAPALHIACWGDSLTFGTGTPPGLPFPTVLQRLLPGSDVFNGGIAGEKSYEIAARFLADESRWVDFTVIWVGRNNYSETTRILGDVADMVAALPSPKKFVVLSVLTGDSPNEYAGQSGYNLIHSVNETLRSTYPANYLDILSFLVSQYNPRSQRDITDHLHGIPPSSLRSDDVHLSARGYALVAQRVARFILGGRVSP